MKTKPVPVDNATSGTLLSVYAVNEKDGDRTAWWQKIGRGFTNRDGSITIYLDALPLGTNKLTIRDENSPHR